jgi:hypothetical protein
MNGKPKERTSLILRYLSGLRFPWLLAITAVLLGLDLLIPDMIPLADELLLGLVTLVLAAWRKRKDDWREEKNTIDVQATPSGALPSPTNTSERL